MAVVASDLKIFLSGGASNSNPNNSIGGIISSSEVSTTVMNNLFDNVSDAEAVAGDVEYRCIYLSNENATDTLNAAAVFIQSNTPSGDSAIAIGLDPAGIGNGSTTGVAATPANENTAPAGVTFSTPSDSGSALAIGTLDAGEVQAIWIRRTISAAAASAASDPFTLRVTGTPA
jgi:hypothetical protein